MEEGKLLSLKSYLRKHRDLDVSFTQGKRERSPLHLACDLGDDAVLRLLLKHGADVLLKDRKGNTALHVAVNRALKHGKTGERINKPFIFFFFFRTKNKSKGCIVCLYGPAYDDLVVPLKKRCPEALNAVNNAGVTPEDLLTWMKHKEVIMNNK